MVILQLPLLVALNVLHQCEKRCGEDVVVILLKLPIPGAKAVWVSAWTFGVQSDHFEFFGVKH